MADAMRMPDSPTAPLIGITADIIELPNARPKAGQAMTYINAVAEAGGVPILLPPVPDLAPLHAAACDAVIFTGGDDPAMEPLGGVTHPQARTMHPQRQAYEFALFRELDKKPGAPVLGICLGMQLMSLHRGGTLNQHLPDTLPTAEDHRGDRLHPVDLHAGPASPLAGLSGGLVASSHHQSVTNAGTLRVLSHSRDGVIEAVTDPSRPFYLGLQWHPERTPDPNLGAEIFRRLVRACAR